MKKKLFKIGLNSKIALQEIINEKTKNKVLNDYFLLIEKNKKKILNLNKKDIDLAIKKRVKNNLIERLKLNEKKIKQILISIKNIIKLKDPCNKIIETWKRPNGLNISKVTIPLGVMGVIYESRPNVTSDVSSLCFKSGNAVILRGGSEAINTNKILSNLFREALEKNKINKNYVQFINSKNRNYVDLMLSKMQNFIDVIIPRGGKTLVQKVQNLSKIPVIGHLEGICHTYIDNEADMKIASRIIFNSKMRNTAICGATETFLINEKISKSNVNLIFKNLYDKKCKLIGDTKFKKKFNGSIQLAKEKDWSTEYLSATVSIKTVKNIDEAITHINKYGTMHTDSIITKNSKKAKKFLTNVKSSIAMHNTSTQFADGGEFGFGGEVGISTNKLPPRGPVGLNQLVSYKYQIKSNCSIRD